MTTKEEEAERIEMEKMMRMKRRRVMEEFNPVQESEPADMKEGRAFRLWTG